MSTNATKRKGKLIKNERHAITSEYSLDGLFDEFYRVKVAEGRANREVGLIDLDVPFANMASLFRFKPTFTWNDWDPKEGIVRNQTEFARMCI